MGVSRRMCLKSQSVERSGKRPFVTALVLVAAATVLASCASAPQSKKRSSEYFPESKYGVKASKRVVEYGQPVPEGGGRYMVGDAYTVKGQVYRPFENKRYKAVGYASWYGSAFHGRYTANGEVYDMDSLSAAHPTMPLPSYARVTNTQNGASLVVRVNDRGPYEKGRLIDLSSHAAELLQVKRHGSAKVKIEYIGPARIEGHDRRLLLATYMPPSGGHHEDSNVMVAMAEVKRQSAIAVAMRNEPDSGPQPLPPTRFALNSPPPLPWHTQPAALLPHVVVARAQPAPVAAPAPIIVAVADMPVPRARPIAVTEQGTAITPYDYEARAAEADVRRSPVMVAANAPVEAIVPAAEPVAQQDVAEPTVVQASAAGGTAYGERSLGSFTVKNPSVFATPSTSYNGRSSYAADPDFTEAERAAEEIGAAKNAGLKLQMQKVIATMAEERSADATIIAAGVFASSDNAAAMAGRLARLGRPVTSDVTIGGKPMHAVRLVVTDTRLSEADLVAAVVSAGARGAHVIR